MRSIVVALAASACGAAPAMSGNHGTPEALSLDEQGVGAIDANATADARSLHALLPGYDIKQGDDASGEASDTGSGGRLHGAYALDIYDQSERVLQVVPGEGSKPAFVHAVSAKIAVVGHPWRIGGKLPVASVDGCECLGKWVVCYKTGSHVAVALAHLSRNGRPYTSIAACGSYSPSCPFVGDCKGMHYAKRTVDLSVVDGATIERVVWGAQPFGEEPREAFPR